MEYLPNVIFVLVLAGAIGFFASNVRKLRRNIFLGRKLDRNDNKQERWQRMALIALGQTKMVVRPVAGITSHHRLSGVHHHQYRIAGDYFGWNPGNTPLVCFSWGFL